MEPDKFFPYTQIDVIQFPDGLGGNDIIDQTFKGPIQQQLRERTDIGTCKVRTVDF